MPPPRNIQFINLSHPADGSSADSRQRAHSHAAREAHARTRRLRTEAYRAQLERPRDRTGLDDSHIRQEQGVNGQGEPGAQAGEATSSAGTAVEAETAVVPSPVSVVSSHRRDPFSSYISTFKPIEHFLLDHYVRAVVPHFQVHCAILRGSPNLEDRMTREWVRLGLEDAGFLYTLFLASCRHLSLYPSQEEYYNRLAVQYKVACLRFLRQAVSAASTPSAVSNGAVGMAIALAFDEIALGDINASRHHVEGAVRMAELKNGHYSVGLDAFLGDVIRRCVDEKGMLCDKPPVAPCGSAFMRPQEIF